MGCYDAQLICLNGHQITDSYHERPTERKNFCDKCGEPTIWQCMNCGEPIRGTYILEGMAAVIESRPTEIPDFCEDCGDPYPWASLKKQIEEAAISKSTESAAILVLKILSRFHLFAKQIRERRDGRVTIDVADEYDVQDAVHAILRLFFDDIRPEEWTPSYAGGSSRIDFLLKNEEIVIEVKMTRKGLGAKELSNQLIIDIERYRKSHPNAKTLICFAYDPEGRVSNPSGIEKDLSRKENNLEVKVLIVPKGY